MLLIFSWTNGFAEELPFWKRKEKAYQRVQNGEILVAVRRKDKAFQVDGGGWVKATCGAVESIATDFLSLPKLTDSIKHLEWHEATGRMRLTFAALGFKSEMDLSVKKQIGEGVEFQVLSGPLKGHVGSVRWQSVRSDQGVKVCEVGLHGVHLDPPTPLPAVFVDFGWEVVLQKMAERLRASAERAPRKAATRDGL